FHGFLRSLTRGSVKVGRRMENCAGCKLRRSPGLAGSHARWRKLRIAKIQSSHLARSRSSRSEMGCSGQRAKYPPHSRAAATASHRLPEHEVRGDCGGAEPTVGCMCWRDEAAGLRWTRM